MNVFSHYGRIRIDSNDNLSLEKTMTLHNMIIFMKSNSIGIIITTTVIFS